MNKNLSPPVAAGIIVVALLIVAGLYYALFLDHPRTAEDTAKAYKEAMQKHQQVLQQQALQQPQAGGQLPPQLLMRQRGGH